MIILNTTIWYCFFGLCMYILSDIGGDLTEKFRNIAKKNCCRIIAQWCSGQSRFNTVQLCYSPGPINR